MPYVVYVNHPNNKAIIHNEGCHKYRNRRRNETHNGYWKRSFNNFKEATEFAQSTQKGTIDYCAFCCGGG
jgi:hypothetical protein